MQNFFDHLRYEKRYSPHTCTAYEADMVQFAGFLKRIYELDDPSQASPQQIRAWMVDMVECKTQPRSIRRKISTLRAYFKYMMKRGEVTVNPVNKVLTPKTSKPLPAFVEEGSMADLLDETEFPDGFEGVRDRTMLEILYGAGLRRSELMGLRMQDLDRANRRFMVLGKGSKTRLVPWMPYMDKVLDNYLAAREAEFPGCTHPQLLLTDKGEPLYAKLVYNKVKHYLLLVPGLEHRSPHVLRHTFATHLLSSGAELNAIKDLLGHASLASTQVYLHNSIEQLKKTYDQAHPKA